MVLIGIFIIYVDGDAFPTVVYKKLMLLFCDLLYLMSVYQSQIASPKEIIIK